MVRLDEIESEMTNIRERIGVAPIEEKMGETRLRCFGHVERRPVNSIIRRVDQVKSSQITRGRPRKTIRKTIKKYLEINDLDRNMLYDKTYGIVQTM